MAGRDKHRYTFYERPHSKAGQIAFYLAVFSALCLLVCAAVSMKRGGAGPVLAGTGLIAAALSVYGFVTGLRSFKEKETLPLFSILGSVGCGIMTVIWMMVILSGL